MEVIRDRSTYALIDKEKYKFLLTWYNSTLIISQFLFNELSMFFPLDEGILENYIGLWLKPIFNNSIEHINVIGVYYSKNEIHHFIDHGTVIGKISDLIRKSKDSLNENVNDKLEDIVLTYIDLITSNYTVLKHFEQIPQTEPPHTKTWFYFIEPKTYKWLFI
jgi:hypothetical protein